MSGVRLDKVMANLGYGSRKDILRMAQAGRISLHGSPVTKPDQAIALDEVTSGALTLDGEILDPPSPLMVMLHKPPGYICSHDEKGLLVYDLLPPRWKVRKPTLSCAGRLDKDSTGQVILTDDGDKLHRMTHPKSHATKYYAVTLASPLRGDETALFAAGTFLMQDDVKPLKPAQWTQQSGTSGVMALQEGRFHQIRRMFETLGNQVVALHRYQTGALALGDLPSGQYRILNERDIQSIFESQS